MTNVVNIANNNSSIRIDEALSIWLSGTKLRVSAGCALVNISDSGGAVIVPVDQPVPSDDFDVVVMSTESDSGILTILQAEKRWIDMNYSSTHKKMGVEFVNINALKLQVIRNLIKIIDSQAGFSFACNIVNYQPTVV